MVRRAILAAVMLEFMSKETSPEKPWRNVRIYVQRNKPRKALENPEKLMQCVLVDIVMAVI